jgi:hypothetical protein
MNKLAHFIQHNRNLGARDAMQKVALPIPKSRLGRLGAIGAIGLGAYGLANRKEESFLDKAQKYVNNIDPSTINTAMGLYSQMANPHSTMGYSPDMSMGIDYSQPGADASMMEEYPEMYEQEHTKTSGFLDTAKRYLRGGAIGAGATAGLAGLGSIANQHLHDQGFLKTLANKLDDVSGYGLAGGTAAGLVGAGLAGKGAAGAKAVAAKGKADDMARILQAVERNAQRRPPRDYY